MIPRLIAADANRILEDYGKMLFLSGPRQVGKTTFARAELERFGQGIYFNWDVIDDQKRLLRTPYFFAHADRDTRRPFLVVFDEIHKYARWKSYLKGAWDGHHEEFRFMVTGSGRLDLFKRGGESLLGRYLALPLFPFTVGELAGVYPDWPAFRGSLEESPPATAGDADALSTLLDLSGFPEPYLRGETAFYNAWFQERKQLLIREDVRSVANIREISLLEMLSHLLPPRVGAPLSLNSLREDVSVAFETIRSWVELLDRFYYSFRLTPYAGSLQRTLRKEAKLYLYDWVEVPEEGPRFENLIAVHLLKAVSTWRARGDGDLSLHYVRDREKREVDFVITDKRRPVCLVECKLGDETPSPALLHFQQALSVPYAVQLLRKPGICRRTRNGTGVLWVISADRWLGQLP